MAAIFAKNEVNLYSLTVFLANDNIKVLKQKLEIRKPYNGLCDQKQVPVITFSDEISGDFKKWDLFMLYNEMHQDSGDLQNLVN